MSLTILSANLLNPLFNTIRVDHRAWLTRLETLMTLISDRPAVVIVDADDRVTGILTKIDILDYLSSQIR